VELNRNGFILQVFTTFATFIKSMGNVFCFTMAQGWFVMQNNAEVQLALQARQPLKHSE